MVATAPLVASAAGALGHDEVSLHLPPLQTLILRGAEWAATGEVTLPVLEEAKDY